MKNMLNGDQLQMAFHCGQATSTGASDPSNVALVLQANRQAGSVTTGGWGAAVESFLVVNTRAAVMTRLGEIGADSGDCSN